MSNPFVQYLNSLHNEQASNQNAIGESQIRSPFFGVMQVKRDVIAFLKSKVAAGRFIILTGHAGDGKTTLLAQVIEAFGIKCTELQKSGEINTGNGSRLHYIKDFSELTVSEQDTEMELCLGRARVGMPSMLVANTGPLLRCLMRKFGSDYEGTLLDAMDDPAGRKIEFADAGDTFVLNIARIDNTDFIRPYIHNIISDVNWRVCNACPKADVCPIHFNRRMIALMENRVSEFIENVYIWLEEYDRRATIRQITAHLAFSVTGGLSCETVLRSCKQNWRYRYLFSNLFFGCIGSRPVPSARQIRGIALIDDEGFDRRQTTMDYTLFVKNDISPYFAEELGTYLYDIIQKTAQSGKPETQRILKRAYMMFGQNQEQEDVEFQECIFSQWFRNYLHIRSGGKRVPSRMRDDICRAIGALFIGDSLEEQSSTIYLTLRRNNEQMCNVQLLRGSISMESVEIKGLPQKTFDSGKVRNNLALVTDRLKFIIGLPLLNYFCEIKSGVIVTDIDPMLSNGIDSLKAQLLESAMTNQESDTVAVVYLKGSKWSKRRLTIDGERLESY